MNKEKIREEAKGIMDDFAKKLKKVKEPKSFGFRVKKSTRKAVQEDWDSDFREKMLENAPKTRDDCIVGEKKHW